MDTMKLLLVAGGGYLAYRYLTGGMGTAAAPSSGVVATSAAAAPAAASAPAVSSGASIQALVQQAANNAGYAGQLLTCDQWNYFFSQVRGVSAFDCGQPNINRTEKISLQEFWNLGIAAGAGMSGLGRYVTRAGLGNYVTATGVRF